MASDRREFARLVAAALGAVGLVVSVALLVDSLRPVPAFCAKEGCAAVRETSWSRPLGIPMPAIGIAFFATLLALVAAGPRAARARTLVALAGGAGALGLVAIQGLVIGEWCRLCVVVDLAAIACAALIASGARSWQRAGGRSIAVAAAAIALTAVALPFVAFRPAEPPVTAPAAGLPEVIAREQVPGTVVVVDFIDFECPHCRALHVRLAEALARVDAQVRVVRKMVPLPQHRGAIPAAVAWCCADSQGRGDEMAEALLAAPVSELTTEGCERLASDAGVDLDRYRRDLSDPAIRRRIQADMADAHSCGVRSLPTVYIGREAFIGAAASVDDLAAAIRRAAAG